MKPTIENLKDTFKVSYDSFIDLRKGYYSDTIFIHRFKWVDKESVEALFGSKALEELQSYYNPLNIDEDEFTNIYNTQFTGYYNKFDKYLIVHSIIQDGDKTWSVYWSNDTILSKKEVTYKDVKNPYRVQKLNSSNRTEYYGKRRLNETNNREP